MSSTKTRLNTGLLAMMSEHGEHGRFKVATMAYQHDENNRKRLDSASETGVER